MKKYLFFSALIFAFLGKITAQTKCSGKYGTYKERAFLGIYSDGVSKAKAKALGFENPYGDLVTGVLLNTAAEEVGLQALDYIYGLDGFRVSREQGLSSILRRYSVGDNAEIHYIRKGKKMKGDLVFRSRSESQNPHVDDCEQAFLGVWSAGKSHDGVKVDVGKKTTASAMGLEDGDVIMKMNGYKVYSWGDLVAFMDGLIKAGDMLEITYYRSGKIYNTKHRVMSYAEYHECDGCDCRKHDYAYSGTKGFEEKMERFGEKMDKWGEKFGAKMEKFGDKLEFHVENLADDIEEIFGDHDYDDDDDQSGQFRSYDHLKMRIEAATESDARAFHPGDGSKLPIANDLKLNDLKLRYDDESGRLTFSFSLPVSGYTLVRLYATSGRLVYDFDLGDFSGPFSDRVNVGKSGAGSYYFIVVFGNRSITRKIILE